PKDLALPGFIGIGGTPPRIGPGFLGMGFAPFTLPNPRPPPPNIPPPPPGGPPTTPGRPRPPPRPLLHRPDRLHQGALPHLKSKKGGTVGAAEEAALREAAGSAAQAHAAIYKKAFDLTVSPLRSIFEVNRESARTIQDYCGMQRNNFGLGCLLARKLDETGVTCVEVDLCGLDIHTVIFN